MFHTCDDGNSVKYIKFSLKFPCKKMLKKEVAKDYFVIISQFGLLFGSVYARYSSAEIEDGYSSLIRTVITL